MPGSWCASAELKHAGSRIDPAEMEIDMNTDRLSPEQALTSARALAEGCTLYDFNTLRTGDDAED